MKLLTAYSWNQIIGNKLALFCSSLTSSLVSWTPPPHIPPPIMVSGVITWS